MLTYVLPMRELVLSFADAEALRADVEANLRRARAFVAGAVEVAERSRCVLVLVHPETGQTLRVEGEVVYVKPEEPGMGVGLKLDPIAPDTLAAFALGGGAPEPALDELLVVDEEDAEAPAEELLVVDDVDAEGAADELLVVDESEAPHGDGTRTVTPARDAASHSLFERIRKLSLVEQQRVARNGPLGERIALERAFGPSVWEALLSNSRLSVPEVARIAKKGTLPKPLIDVIAANGTWLGTPDVQRALLSNPRTGGTVLLKVLRALSRSDLARVPQQTAYPMAARQAAKKMLKDA